MANISRGKKINIAGYLFTAPSLILLALLVVYPLFYGFFISFFDTNLVNKWDFVGLKHYKTIFATPDFPRSIWITLKFTFLVVLGHFGIGMCLALLLNKEFKGRMLFRAIFMLPWLFPEVVVALLWKWIFNPLYGLLNHIMMNLGLIEEGISWISDSKYAFASVVFVCIWKGYPMIMLMILAGLQSISEDLYEAGRLDGCNSFQLFRHITLPSLIPVLMVALILDTVWWFKHYTMVWILTAGGPGNDTSLVSIDVYKTAFSFFNFGKGAAMAFIVFILCFILGAIYKKIFGNENE